MVLKDFLKAEGFAIVVSSLYRAGRKRDVGDKMLDSISVVNDIEMSINSNFAEVGLAADSLDEIQTKDIVKIKKYNVAETYSQSGTEWLMHQVKKFPLLTKDEELELIKRAQAGDTEAKHLLCNCNLRLVIKIAKSYKPSSLELLDLVQEGTIGLMRAIDKYDFSAGTKFSTCAYWWIRQAIGLAIENKERVVRLPSYLINFVTKINTFKKTFGNQHGREPSIKEIAEGMGVKEEKVISIYKYITPMLSLDRSPTGNDSVAVVEKLSDFVCDDSYDIDEFYDVSFACSRIVKTLNEMEMSPRNRYILESRLEVNGRSFKTHVELANELGITRQRCQQIEKSYIEKLKEAISPYMHGIVGSLV